MRLSVQSRVLTVHHFLAIEGTSYGPGLCVSTQRRGNPFMKRASESPEDVWPTEEMDGLADIRLDTLNEGTLAFEVRSPKGEPRNFLQTSTGMYFAREPPRQPVSRLRVVTLSMSKCMASGSLQTAKFSRPIRKRSICGGPGVPCPRRRLSALGAHRTGRHVTQAPYRFCCYISSSLKLSWLQSGALPDATHRQNLQSHG